MLDSPFFLPAAGAPGLGMFRTVRPVLLGPARSCSVLLGPARSCSILFDPVRSCSVLLGPARSCSVLFGPARSGSVLLGPVRLGSVRFATISPRSRLSRSRPERCSALLRRGPSCPVRARLGLSRLTPDNPWRRGKILPRTSSTYRQTASGESPDKGYCPERSRE